MEEYNPYQPSAAAIEEAPDSSRGTVAARSERFSAWIVDWLLVALVSTLGALISEQLLPPGAGPLARDAAPWIPVIGLVALNLWLLRRSGQTVGKWNRDIRMVRNDGSRAGVLRLALLRFALPWVIYILPAFAGLPLLGFIFFVADVLFIYAESNRCLHDRLADTKVIYA